MFKTKLFSLLSLCLFFGSAIANQTSLSKAESFDRMSLQSANVDANSDSFSITQTQCLNQFCVGEQVYNVSRESRLTLIEGIDSNRKFLLRFLDTNQLGSGWDASDLAKTFGCYQDICVNQSVYNVSREFRLTTVKGFQLNGKFVLQFMDNAGIGSGWDRWDLAITSGCLQNNSFCVGDKAYNIQRNNRVVEIMGIATNQTMVLKFMDNNGIGGNWSQSDLVRVNTLPPPPPYCPPGTVWNPSLGRCVNVPPPPPAACTCTITNQVGTWSARDRSCGVARATVLQTCARQSSGYPCPSARVVCR